MARRVTPEEAKDLIDKEGWVYVDVRSVGEFDGGHATGAYNVPFNHIGQAGVRPNEKFMAAMEKVFAKDGKVILACQGGGRSARAAAQLDAAGFTNVADLTAGFEGKIDPATRQAIDPGWRRKNLPVTQDSTPEKTWAGIEAKLDEGE
jgi:rhodanese-related sulfurtransferase